MVQKALLKDFFVQARTIKAHIHGKADIAFQELEADMMKVIKQDEESVRMLKTILTKAKDRMMQDD